MTSPVTKRMLPETIAEVYGWNKISGQKVVYRKKHTSSI